MNATPADIPNALRLENVHAADCETLFQWLDQLSRQQIQVSDVRQRVVASLMPGIDHELRRLKEPKHLFNWFFQAKRDPYLEINPIFAEPRTILSAQRRKLEGALRSVRELHRYCSGVAAKAGGYRLSAS